MRRLVVVPRACLAWSPLAIATALGCADPAEPPGSAQEVSSEIFAAPVFTSVVAGVGHSCGLTASGTAYCWGGNSEGQLGIGAVLTPDCPEAFCTTPKRVVGDLTFSQLSAGTGYTCGVVTDGRLFCWGSNDFTNLGDGTEVARDRPVHIGSGLAFRQVSAGVLHTCAVTRDHAAYCWGHNQAGPLGTGNVVWADVPAGVAGSLKFREVSAGGQFTCGVTTADVAYCWGMNRYGELGIGVLSGPESCFTGDGFNPCSTVPARVIRGLAVRSISTGEDHACAVTRDDLAYCWGASYGGQLGNGSIDFGPCGEQLCNDRPRLVRGRLRFHAVNVFEASSCGVSTDHVAYCWGTNFSGELGNGSRTGPEPCSILDISCASRPVHVAGERRFAMVDAGGHHSCGVTTTGRTLCWGDNSWGQLGDGTTRSRPWPKPVLTGN